MIHVCTNPSRFLDMLSPEDRVAAQVDLVMFGMFTIEDRGGVARRVDPQLVRVPVVQKEAIDDYVVAFDEATQVATERKSSLRWREIFRQMNQDPILGIWKREDPGAK